MVESTRIALMEDLRSRMDKERGKMVASYMKTSSLEFLGVSVTEARKITRSHIKGLVVDDLPILMEQLWKEPIFDFKLAAIEVLEKYSAEGDIKTAFIMIDRMIEDVDTWSTVDPLCIVCLANVILRDPAYEKKIARWRTSSNFWRRRATLLPYVHLAKKRIYREGYAKRALAAVIPHLSDTEFFVAKAVGWVLRELSKREPDIVRRFIEENREKMTKLSIREGSKKL
ncbi:MAG: DNA alkylation repair protein [Candidatus Thorarchaeota archaeon]|jgi:3-methyladenine DNA glycosylase AlkD